MDCPDEKQNKSQELQQQISQCQNYHGYEQEYQLPEMDAPNEEHHPPFFKTKTRLTQEQLNVQIGLLVLKYDHFQQDFITYLANMLMCEVDFLNIFITDPLHLYLSMNVVAEEGLPTVEFIQVQANAYRLLKYCRQVILKFMNNNISQNAIFEENGPSSEQIITKFQQQVIKPLNDKHEQLFSTNYGNKW